MDEKAIRRSCNRLLDNFYLSDAGESQQVIGALIQRMKVVLEREVQHRLVSFPPNTVSGLWVATDAVDYILCEKRTSPWHQLLITVHEFWHIEAEHEATSVGNSDGHQLAFSSLNPSAVARIMAGRSHYDALIEREADFFASVFLARLTRLLTKLERYGSGTPSAVFRVERTLGDGSLARR